MNGGDEQLLHLLFECLTVGKKVFSPPVRYVKICTQKRDCVYQESPVVILLGCLRCQIFLPSIMPKPWQRFILPIQDSRPDVHLHLPPLATVWAKVQNYEWQWLICQWRFSSPGSAQRVGTWHMGTWWRANSRGE